MTVCTSKWVFDSTWSSCFFFFFNDPATPEIYTLSLHDALPISARPIHRRFFAFGASQRTPCARLNRPAGLWKVMLPRPADQIEVSREAGLRVQRRQCARFPGRE